MNILEREKKIAEVRDILEATDMAQSRVSKYVLMLRGLSDDKLIQAHTEVVQAMDALVADWQEQERREQS